MAKHVLTETIHHGDYRNVREMEFTDNLSARQLDDFLAASPYPARLSLERLDRILESLSETGAAENGWARFDVKQAPAGPRSYVIGLPVVVTVHDDGRVEYEVDLGEAADAPFEDEGEDWGRIDEDTRTEDKVRIGDFVNALYAV